MSEILQTAKVSANGTASLGDVLTALNAAPGDYIMYYKVADGRVFVDKIKAPDEPKASE